MPRGSARLGGTAGVMSLVVQHLHTFHAVLAEEDRTAGATFLALAIDTEAFETDRHLFLSPGTYLTSYHPTSC